MIDPAGLPGLAMHLRACDNAMRLAPVPSCWTACGISVPADRLTDDWRAVNCQRCRKTEEYRSERRRVVYAERSGTTAEPRKEVK